MKEAINPTVAELVARLDTAQIESWAERAAIREYEAGITRELAEALAALDLVERLPEVFSGLTIILVEVDGVPHHYITTDIDLAREQTTKAGGTEVRATGVAWAVDEEFGGLAELVVAE